MANFLTAEAEAAILEACDEVKHDGVHSHWNLVVSDGANTYAWEDNTLGTAPAAAAMEAAIVAYLITIEKEAQPAAAPVVTVIQDTASLGNTVGSIS